MPENNRPMYRISSAHHDGGGADIDKWDDQTVAPKSTKIGEREYRAVCEFLNDAMNGFQHDAIRPEPPAYTIMLTPAGGTIAHFNTSDTVHHVELSTWAINSFIELCELCALPEVDLKRVYAALKGTRNGEPAHPHAIPLAKQIERAWSDGVAAVITEIGNWEGHEATGTEIHQAWYQGMVAQGREVSVPRRHWHTLDQRDRDLDTHIAWIFLQQMAINVETSVRAARAMGDTHYTSDFERTLRAALDMGKDIDDPAASTGDDARDFLELRGKYYREPHTRLPERLIRDIVAEETLAGKDTNLNPAEWRQLLKDARKRQQDAEMRHARSEELRRADNQQWATEREGMEEIIAARNTTIDQQAQTIEIMHERYNEQARTVDQQARALSEAKELRAALDREIVNLNARITELRAVLHTGNVLHAPQSRFFAGVPELPEFNLPFTAVAAIQAELTAVRMLVNNPNTNDSIGMDTRLRTIAGYVYALYRQQHAGDPVVDESDTKA